MIPTAILAAALAICGPGPRTTCVIDGDTFWYAGVKHRIANIDAPDMPGEGRCTRQNIVRLRASRNPAWCNGALYVRSRAALASFLGQGKVDIQRVGMDQYGRVLATVSVNGRDAGEWMVGTGLARRWVR